MDDLPAATAFKVYPLILTLVEKMTEKQWTFLRSDIHDDAAKFLVAELLLGFITSTTDTVLTAQPNSNEAVTKGDLLYSLGNIIHKTFAEALQVKDEEVTSSKLLTNLIVKEVVDCVNSVVSNNTEEPVTVGHVISPTRLSIMVHLACKTLTEYLTRDGDITMFPPRKPRPIYTTDVDTYEDEDDDDDDENLDDIDEDLPESPVKPISPDSIVAETGKAVLNMIKERVHEITESLLESLDDAEYKLLQYESFVGVETIADNITNLVVQVAKSLKHSDTIFPKRATLQKLYEKGVTGKLQTFFKNMFPKIMIYRLATQLRARYCDKSSRAKMPSVQSFMDGYVHMGADEAVFEALETFSGKKTLDFIKRLSDHLFTYIKHGIAPDRARRITPQGYAEIYADIVQRVRYFLSLINWWCQMEANRIGNRMVLTLMNFDIFSLWQQQILNEEVTRGAQGVTKEAATACDEQSAQGDTLKTEERRTAVKMLVENLLALIEMKSNGPNFDNLEALTKRVFEKTWSEVEAVDFDPNKETVKNVDRAVFRDMCKDWGDAQTVMISLSLRERLIERRIATYFKVHLTPKEPGAVARFFSSMANAVSRPFKRGKVVN